VLGCLGVIVGSFVRHHGSLFRIRAAGPTGAFLCPRAVRSYVSDSEDRTFDFVQTFDRATVTQAARAILQRYPH
jgi:hypothetical protein